MKAFEAHRLTDEARFRAQKDEGRLSGRPFMLLPLSAIFPQPGAGLAFGGTMTGHLYARTGAIPHQSD